MQQAAQMQEQMARMQDEAEKETAQSSVGGGLVKVTANGAGEVVAIEISPDAIDPDDPEALSVAVLSAATDGDVRGLEELLAADVTAWSDGGGKVSAALRPRLP